MQTVLYITLWRFSMIPCGVHCTACAIRYDRHDQSERNNNEENGNQNHLVFTMINNRLRASNIIEVSSKLNIVLK